jgi:hypothetical protein
MAMRRMMVLLRQASGAFLAMRRISAAPQSRLWSARRGGIAHSACQEGRRYRLRRRAIDSVPFLSLVTGKASRFWSALRTAGLSEIARVAGFAFLRS